MTCRLVCLLHLEHRPKCQQVKRNQKESTRIIILFVSKDNQNHIFFSYSASSYSYYPHCCDDKIRYISLRETQLWYDTSVDGGPHCDQMGEEKLAQFPQKLPKKSFHNSLYFHSGAFQKSQTDYQIFGCYCYKICCQKLSKIAQSGRADVRGGSI